MVKDSAGHGCNEAAQMLASQRPEAAQERYRCGVPIAGAAQMLASQRPEGGACTGGQRRPPKGGTESSRPTGNKKREGAVEDVGACTGGQRRPPIRENNREILPLEREVQLKGGAETSSHTGDEQGEAAQETAGAGTGGNGRQTTREKQKGERKEELLFREPVRMQVLMPGHDPVEVMAYAPVDARLQAASLLNVDIAEAMRAKVAVETAALKRWQAEHARDAQQ